ncbi:MAG: hypothetical protein H0W86_14350 [Armatimonadetes bacterium]|nr:hypothetical protein [Armatimonadota bacterium]
MTTDIASPEFHLHFEGEGARCHTVPGSVLAQAIESLQRSIHLLAFAFEGRDFKERLRVSYDLERKYAVVVKAPKDGGYDIPYIIGNTASTLFDPQDVSIVTEQHKASLAAVQANDLQALKRIIPHAPIRRQVVSAFQKMQPPKRMGLVVSIEDYRHAKLLNGYTALALLTPMLNEPVNPSIHPRVVTGRLDAIDFQSHSLTLKLPNGRRLNCTYNDDFEPVLLENPREWIQVRGEAVLNEDDSLKDLINISEIIEVDDNPVTVDSLAVADAMFTVTRPLTFKVAFESEEGIYTATGDFHMLISAETREELENSILEALAFLWQEYVTADASTFTADALALRAQLTNTFARAENAA